MIYGEDAKGSFGFRPDVGESFSHLPFDAFFIGDREIARRKCIVVIASFPLQSEIVFPDAKLLAVFF